MFPMQSRSFFFKSSGSTWFCNYIHIVSAFIFLSVVRSQPVLGCWGHTSSNYGVSTADYSLLVGSNLVIDCSLNSGKIMVSKVEYNVTSSNLIFTKQADNRDLKDNLYLVDGLTTQLRIPNATAKDSGTYHCSVAVPNEKAQLVCSTLVHVGYKPKPVHDFRCISRYFENLTCTWNFTKSGVATNYTIYRYHTLTKRLQICPPTTSNSTYCQWRSDTDPPYDKTPETLGFTIIAKNSLGEDMFNFTLNHYAVVLPNRPRRLSILKTMEQEITVSWLPPTNLENGVIPMQYQLWIKDPDPGGKPEVFDVGVNVLNYRIPDLIPYTSYTISVRCRSNFTSREDMWGPFAQTKAQTLPDVPYKIPESVPEAFEILHYEESRGVNMFWQPVAPKYYNGESFTYHIKCFHVANYSEYVPCEKPDLSETFPFATFKNLRENVSYSFRLYASNSQGLSDNYTVITVDRKENILFPPEDITVISNDLGHYEISWKTPKHVSEHEISFVVFWCSSLKPSVRRCEGPIQWLRTSGFNTTLLLPDKNTNFQFAVATTSIEGTSGMRWASCIVPYKAALSKIESPDVTPLNSTSLKVLWRLNCAAQKAVVEQFEIIYCQLNGNLQCLGTKRSVNVSKEIDSYILNNLEPFSNYSVVIRAYKDHLYSENSDPKIVRTKEGAPSDPPQDIKAIAKLNHTILVTWRQPSKPNGHVTHYLLQRNGGKPDEIPADSEKQVYSHEISNLQHYREYTFQLQACHNIDCSPKSAPLTVRTDIGVPGNVDAPRIEAINSSFVKVSWNFPLEPNGPIDFYEVQWKAQQEENVTAEGTVHKKNVTRVETTEVELNCESVEDGGITFLFFVRAANNKYNVTLYGSLSSPTKARGCFMTQGLAMIIGVAIGGTLALAFAALLLFKLIKWMRDTIDEVKSTNIVQLPRGLDGPEFNVLSHQEDLSNGVETPSYGIGDTESKNRHGSGGSQYSNASTDELLYRNGKCTKFGRKPSGESSGCSSMSSNTINAVRTPLSSDSGTESDFHAPPSPDMIFGDHKCPLPIVMESQDSSLQDADPGIQTDQLTSTNDSNNNQHPPVTLKNNLPNGVIVKMDQPYSKFGISRNVHTIPPWWMNPLAFYSCNLANSEPSVFDLDHSPEQNHKGVAITLSPYSKVGLARSSGDILRIPDTEQGLGYSKFGIIRNIERSQSNAHTRRNDPSVFPQDLLSPTIGVAVVNTKPISSELRFPKKCVNEIENSSDRDTNPLSVPHKVSRNYLDPRNLSPYISFKQFTQTIGFIQPRDDEAVYGDMKSGHQMLQSHGPAPDYVTLNEVQGLTYTPKRSPTLPGSDKSSSVASEGENTDNADSVVFPDGTLNTVGLDEMHNLFPDSKFCETDSQIVHVIEISSRPPSDHVPHVGPEKRRPEVHPNLGSNVLEETWNKCLSSDNIEPTDGEDDSTLDKRNYLNQPSEVLDLTIDPPLNNDSVDVVSGCNQNSDSCFTGPPTKALDVCLDVGKPNLPLLCPSSLKTEAEEDFVSPTSLLIEDCRNMNSLPNSCSTDIPGDNLAGVTKYVNKTGGYKECEVNSPCSPQSHAGYVPFVSLISCGNNPRNSGGVNMSHEPDSSESHDVTEESINSSEPRTVVSADHISKASRPYSSDHFKVPEQNSARIRSKDSHQDLHLHPNSQQAVPRDVICDKTSGFHGSPRCTKESLSMNGSLSHCFHLVPMVESEICEV